MSKGNTTENDLMLYIFNGTRPSWDAAANLYLALHTDDPGEAGLQTSNEANYSNYGRIAVARDSNGWTVSNNQAINKSLVQFPQCQGLTSNTITHVSIGTAGGTGGGQILYSGALNSPLSVSNLIQPQFGAGVLVLQED